MAQRQHHEPTDELVEHVDLDGNVIEVVTRTRLRAEVMRHRCTYVFVVRPSGRLVVHQRADWKSIYPGWWDVCFGGICGAGEAWQSAAARELAEEAGLTGEPLRELGPVRYDGDDGHIVGRAYVVFTDAEVTAVDGEVVQLDEIEISSLTQWMEGRLICFDSRQAVLPMLLADAEVQKLVI